ncbi:heme-binding domain-containing protein [Sunxiuqinia dokdonensis]|uniref:Haem-binding domain-containing protein n=1 Tax=Sunxiuqinia dokdonensis TaxID=1409788 RepID=A0A0L8V4L1_9BACT|nr:heme-binding domain-containing protein [Sunxiuqinia dokdonensis]KOH43376.1 hypothetical protein NC99_38030 [Sunxiuqinia dokdonensis]
MKNLNLITSLFLLLLLSSSISFADEKPDEKKITLKMPEDVRAVVDNSCFGCHNTDSRNEDAREHLDFKTMHQLSDIKKLGAFKEIREVIEENEMPPKKFLERRPEKELTEEQKKILIDWVKKESVALMNQNQ